MPVASSRLQSLLRASVLILLTARPLGAAAQAPQNMGPNACVNCHDHQAERQWAATKDGPPPRSHANSLKQLDSAKARLWARRLAIGNVYEISAGCVRCHATIVAGDAAAGVTCESCHGPGRGYAVVHQDKGAYKASVAAGMFDTRGRPEAWVPLCVSCHIMTDRKIIRAGHPSGDTFDAVTKVASVVHWKRTEPAVAIASASRLAVTAALAARLRPAAPAPATVASASAPSTGTPSSGTSAIVPTPASAAISAEQQLLAALEGLLRRNAYVPRRGDALAPVPYLGPDAALLRLQQEIVNLALEALATKPVSASGKAP